MTSNEPASVLFGMTTANVQATAANPSSARSAIPSPAVMPPAVELAADGIPSTALSAYQRAAAAEAVSDPRCGLSWPLLAGIGRVESDHGRSGGAVLFATGVSNPQIIGIALDGHGTALIHDTDHGRYDHDTVYDHAVGPMQFIPSTWALYGADGNGDHVADPFNVYDAAKAAAAYLCAAGGVLNTYAGQLTALHAYNDSDAYATLVLGTEAIYAKGTPYVVPTAPAGHPVVPPPVHIPPADPGQPLGLGSNPAGSSTPPVTSPPVSTTPTTAPATSSPAAPTSSAPGSPVTSTSAPASSSSAPMPSVTPSSSSTPVTSSSAPPPSPSPTP